MIKFITIVVELTIIIFIIIPAIKQSIEDTKKILQEIKKEGKKNEKILL